MGAFDCTEPEPRGGILKQVRTPAQPLEFSAVYGQWLHPVTVWIRALGGRDAEYEDIAQEVFLIVRRKLDRFDGVNIAGWLYRITQLAVRDYRRRSWFRRLVFGRDDGELERVADPGQGADMLEHKDELRFLQTVLDQMDERRRGAFMLFEIEGYTGQEIAELEGIPVATVWTRIHYARKEFFALFAQAEARAGRSSGRGRS